MTKRLYSTDAREFCGVIIDEKLISEDSKGNESFFIGINEGFNDNFNFDEIRVDEEFYRDVKVGDKLVFYYIKEELIEEQD